MSDVHFPYLLKGLAHPVLSVSFFSPCSALRFSSCLVSAKYCWYIIFVEFTIISIDWVFFIVWATLLSSLSSNGVKCHIRSISTLVSSLLDWFQLPCGWFMLPAVRSICLATFYLLCESMCQQAWLDPLISYLQSCLLLRSFFSLPLCWCDLRDSHMCAQNSRDLDIWAFFSS